MKSLECVMARYKEALDELMGAQHYAKEAYKAGTQEDRSMYVSMAKQELEHVKHLENSAGRATAAQDSEHERAVWDHLREHIESWRQNILKKIEQAEHRTM